MRRNETHLNHEYLQKSKTPYSTMQKTLRDRLDMYLAALCPKIFTEMLGTSYHFRSLNVNLVNAKLQLALTLVSFPKLSPDIREALQKAIDAYNEEKHLCLAPNGYTPQDGDAVYKVNTESTCTEVEGTLTFIQGPYQPEENAQNTYLVATVENLECYLVDMLDSAIDAQESLYEDWGRLQKDAYRPIESQTMLSAKVLKSIKEG